MLRGRLSTMWWQPLTPRSSIETKYVHRKMYVIARRPAADVAPLRGFPPVTIRSLQNVGNLDFFRECGLPHHPAGWFAMTCVTLGRSLGNLKNKNRRAAIAVRRYAYLWSFRAQAKPAPASPVRDTKRIPAHRWMVSPVVGLVPSLAARTWKAVSALPSSK